MQRVLLLLCLFFILLPPVSAQFSLDEQVEFFDGRNPKTDPCRFAYNCKKGTIIWDSRTVKQPASRQQ
jgi:hypothetical protein